MKGHRFAWLAAILYAALAAKAGICGIRPPCPCPPE